MEKMETHCQSQSCREKEAEEDADPEAGSHDLAIDEGHMQARAAGASSRRLYDAAQAAVEDGGSRRKNRGSASESSAAEARMHAALGCTSTPYL